MTNNSTTHFATGLIGNPVSHSRSPQIHNAWYQEQNLPITYSAQLVKPDELASYLTELRSSPHKLGVSVTVPHKETIIPLLDEIDAAVKTIGACNTVVKNKNSKLVGHNTDYLGWQVAIQEFLTEHNTDLGTISITILGAGGAARAVAYALRDHPNTQISNRTPHKADQLAQEFGHKSISQTDLPNHPTDLYINTTPLGLHHEDPLPLTIDLISKARFIQDLTYTENQLKKVCQTHNIPYQDGLRMLTAQAEVQHELWLEQFHLLT